MGNIIIKNKNYDTKLNSTEEKEFQRWRNTLPISLQSDYDYDLRGFWKENPNFKIKNQDDHLTDKFKKPNHPTFSTESIYSTKDNPGGTWRKQFGQYIFTPSKEQESRGLKSVTEGEKWQMPKPSKPIEKMTPKERDDFYREYYRVGLRYRDEIIEIRKSEDKKRRIPYDATKVKPTGSDAGKAKDSKVFNTNILDSLRVNLPLDKDFMIGIGLANKGSTFGLNNNTDTGFNNRRQPNGSMLPTQMLSNWQYRYGFKKGSDKEEFSNDPFTRAFNYARMKKGVKKDDEVGLGKALYDDSYARNRKLKDFDPYKNVYQDAVDYYKEGGYNSKEPDYDADVLNKAKEFMISTLYKNWEKDYQKQIKAYGGEMKKAVIKNNKQGRGLTKTFAFGGIDLDTPAAAIYNSQKQVAQADLDTMNDTILNTMKGVAVGMNWLGNQFQNVASSKMKTMAGTKGYEAGTDNAANLALAQKKLDNYGRYTNAGYNTLFGLSQFGDGGIVPVEVEGNEIGQLPDGQMLNFQGPSHEQGGIDANLPAGTKIYSDRVSIDGKTMAQRKKYRENKIANLEKKSGKGDRLAKDTLDRYMLTANQEEQLDMSIQELLNNQSNNRQQFGAGSRRIGVQPLKLSFQPNMNLNTIGLYPEEINQDRTNNYSTLGAKNVNPNLISEQSLEIYNPTFGTKLTPQEQVIADRYGKSATVSKSPISSSWADTIMNNLPVFGDIAGMAGSMHSAYAGKRNTLINRAGDKPNINVFTDFGKESLKTIEDSKGLVQRMGDIQRDEIELARRSATAQNRQTARGINTMRAMDLASQANANKLDMQVYQNELQQLLGISGQQAQMQAARDQAVMQGEQARDLADRQDRDQFYTNMIRDEQSIGQGWQQLGKSMNKVQERNATVNAMNNAYSNFAVDINGRITGIPGGIAVPNFNWKDYYTEEQWKDFTALERVDAVERANKGLVPKRTNK